MHAARTPLPTPGFALAMLAGVSACLALPGIPPVAVSALLAALGIALVLRAPRLRWPAALLLGFGLAGLHAAHALHVQLRANPTHHDAVIVGRIADLPRIEPRRTAFLFDVDAD